MKLLLAVSGGIDSMYMAEQFLRTDGADAIAVAHCNFQLRGAESDGDEAFVREWCERNGVECYVTRFETSKYAVEKGVSIEMAARELRYGWFAQLCREKGFRGVAVAHNADDNAETLMLNLLRGTGGRGLRGMSAKGRVPGAADVELSRPLLSVQRKEIEVWMAENGVQYRQDSTNDTTLYKRNKIRHKVFPVFKEINPSFLNTLSRNMKYFSQENDIVEEYYESNREKVFRDGKIDIKALLSLKHWEYVLFRLTEPYGFNVQNLEALTRSLKESGGKSGRIYRAPGYEMVSGPDSLIIRKAEEAHEEEPLEISAPGEYEFNGTRLVVEVFERDASTPVRQPEGILAFDADKLGFPFTLRKWEKGDWLKPLGLKGKKKLSDLFGNLKFSLVDKNMAIVVESSYLEDGHVAALLGRRIDETMKISESTNTITLIRTI